jgi:hypothetical protein
MTRERFVQFFQEPTLTFGHGQVVEDPRDGLTLFGPLDAGKPYGIRVGVIGTARGIEYFRDWSRRIQGPLADAGSQVARPAFPGFEAVFRVPFAFEPAITIVVPDADIHTAVHLDDAHQRVHGTVSVFSQRILDTIRQEETSPDFWFVVIPEIVYENCRPRSRVARDVKIKATWRLKPATARELMHYPSLFAEENKIAEAYEYDPDFHNQLKARLLNTQTLTQIVQEGTVMPVEGIPETERPTRDSRPFQAAIAWNLGTAAFYKAGGRPWKINGIRDGVCYVGLVFKQDQTKGDRRTACCAAQMFLDSGDGTVFRGAVGPWYSEERKEFHLNRTAASELVKLATDTYKRYSEGKAPAELFLHGKVSFSDEEWLGFRDAVDSTTNLVGIKIRDDADVRLFRLGDHPVLRGTAYIRHPRSAYLWTKGFSPRLRTYIGREVPRPLRIEIDRGEADMGMILADIMALTKLNYNTCLLADGLPVTLRFADAVGEILTAGPVAGEKPLPFKHYI